MEHIRHYTALLYREIDGYSARCPEIGTVSQGDDAESAIANLRDATEPCLNVTLGGDNHAPSEFVFEVRDGD